MTRSPGQAALRAGSASAPSLVVIGAPRCGTTSLATWLTDIGLGVGIKDSFYLMDDDAGLRGPTHLTTHGIPGYLSLFPNHPQPTIECSAGYVYQRRALEFFRQWEEPPAFVLVARDPVERLRSVHRYFAGNLSVLPRDMDFETYVDALYAGSVGAPDKTVSNALAQGRYAEALKPWVDAFGRDRVDVVPFDDLRQRPAEVVERLARLSGGTPRIDPRSYTFSSRNESYMPHSRVLSWTTARARRLIPTGSLRAWGGERLRRLQVARERRANDDPRSAAAPPEADVTEQRLSQYYDEPNRELSRRFGVPTAGWA